MIAELARKSPAARPRKRDKVGGTQGPWVAAPLGECGAGPRQACLYSQALGVRPKMNMITP